jgi:hypothetical protein
MISVTRRAANQGNAQNSTGPSSAAGKAVSRMNALKTGLYAKSLVIRGESREEFDELAAQFNDQYCPVTPQARILVDILIRQTWILRRIDRIESEHWEESFRRIDGRHGDKSNATSQAFDLGSRTHDRIRRFADSAERSIIRTLNKLDRLTEYFHEEPDPQAVENPVPAEPAAPQLVASEPASAEIGFVPSEISATFSQPSFAGFQPAICSPGPAPAAPRPPASWVSDPSVAPEKRSA